jgi:hypothetical protein
VDPDCRAFAARLERLERAAFEQSADVLVADVEQLGRLLDGEQRPRLNVSGHGLILRVVLDGKRVIAEVTECGAEFAA